MTDLTPEPDLQRIVEEMAPEQRNACCPECGAGVAWKPEVAGFLCFVCGLVVPAERAVVCEDET